MSRDDDIETSWCTMLKAKRHDSKSDGSILELPNVIISLR